LRDAAAAGCAGEIELLAQRQEVIDLLHLQWLSPLVRRAVLPDFADPKFPTFRGPRACYSSPNICSPKPGPSL
jgi:hypothetical protein